MLEQASLKRVAKSCDRHSQRPPPKKERQPIKELYAAMATKVPAAHADFFSRDILRVPSGFHIHPKLERLRRAPRYGGWRLEKATIDWGMGEHLAFATLLIDRKHVGLQDKIPDEGHFPIAIACGWIPDQAQLFSALSLKRGQGLFDIYNSPLSEYAVLGFEFGYSIC